MVVSVPLQTKWLWVWISLLSLKLRIWRLFQARSSLTFRQTIKCRFTPKFVGDMIVTYSQHILFLKKLILIFCNVSLTHFFNSLFKSKYWDLWIIAAFSNRSFSGKYSSPVKIHQYFYDDKTKILATCLPKSFWAIFGSALLLIALIFSIKAIL